MDKKLFSHCSPHRTLNSLRMALASPATEHRVCPFADHYCATWLFNKLNRHGVSSYGRIILPLCALPQS